VEIFKSGGFGSNPMVDRARYRFGRTSYKGAPMDLEIRTRRPCMTIH
jgi:hypothetical protein